MFDSFSDGYCPQCLLDDKKIPLVVNHMDVWECPVCRLRCVSDGVSVLSIIRERGNGRPVNIIHKSNLSGKVMNNPALNYTAGFK